MFCVKSIDMILATQPKQFILFCCRLVNKINSSIGQDPNSKFLIGVLDIYGFESFKTNRCLAGML